jgi:hypothetical protein
MRLRRFSTQASGLIPRRDPCSSCVACACCCSSPWRHMRQTLVSILHARRGGTPNSHGLITRMVPLSLHRTRCHVFARPCCAVTAGWRGVPPNVTRPRRRSAAVRRTVISTPNRWEVISVTANDNSSASTVVPPALLSLRGVPAPAQMKGDDRIPSRRGDPLRRDSCPPTRAASGSQVLDSPLTLPYTRPDSSL